MTPLKKALIAKYANLDLIAWVGDKDLKTSWETCNEGAGWLIEIARVCGVPRPLLVYAMAKATENALKVYDSKRLRSAVYWSKRYGRGTVSESEYDERMKKMHASCRYDTNKLNEAADKAGIQHEGAQIVRDNIPFKMLKLPDA